MKPFIKIGERNVGYDYEPLVIAEIGINHGGSLEVAKAMVDSAILAGAEVIKHQTHIVEDEMSSSARKTIPGNASKSIFDIMEECALSESEEYELMSYVTERGAIFISTPFSRAAADRLIKFDIPAFKIGSGECNNYPLLRHISKVGKPIILSTGMNTIDDIKGAVEIFEEANIPYALLHTTNLYPTPDHLVRLGALSDISEAFPKAVIGLSDHTLSNHACFGAVALGASILERHYTDSYQRIGPDIVCSMDPLSMKELIEGARIIFKQRGGNKFDSVPEEQVTKDFAFATVVATKNIKKGELLTEKNIWVKRPGIGEIKARDYESILGKFALDDISFDSHLKWDNVSK